MKRAITTLCLILFAAVASGATVEISTEGWTGSGVTNGWSFANLGEPFANGAARLGDGAWIASPTWPEIDILSVTICYECPVTTPDRSPQVTLLRDGATVDGPIELGLPFFANRAERTTIRVQQETQANGIVLDLPGDGLSCWGILSVVLATVPTSRPKPPRRKNGRGFAVVVR